MRMPQIGCLDTAQNRILWESLRVLTGALDRKNESS